MGPAALDLRYRSVVLFASGILAGGRGGSSVDESSSEDYRALYQERLRAWSGGLALVDVVFNALFALALSLDPSLGFAAFVRRGAWFEAVPELCLWTTTWALLRARALGLGTLRALEIAVVALAGCLYAGWLFVHSIAQVGVFEMLLSVVAVSLFRSFVVPGGPARTAAMTALLGAPGLLVIATGAHGPGAAPADVARPTLFVIAVAWIAVAAAFAALASAVILGLRRAVRDARRLGPYTLIEKLGAGGMGTVYLARHALLRRPTALKILDPEQSTAESIARFEREVQLTSELAHPNVVAIHDYGRTEDGVFYYVMEYLDGVDLERLVADTGPMPPARARHVLLQICAALDEAHARGLVHRDVKPANVILCARRGGHDAVKVCDFGLVKDLRPDSGAVTTTKQHTIVGTPLYLSPEAVSGRSLDARSDLYAVGAVAFWLLTGRPVFDAKTVVEVCAQHLHAAPPRPSERNAAVPEAFDAIVLRCLAKRPEERFARARALADALAALDTGEIGAWTAADAEAFWARHASLRRSHEAARIGETHAAIADTVRVELGDRAA